MAISDRFSAFLGGSRPAVDDERLLQLYWNRAELKKELTRLQGERDRLLDRVQKQEGATIKLREQLDQLEQHLGDPDVAIHALVYFQLRSLWRSCAVKLAKFSHQLQQQQEERERRRQLIEFDQHRRREMTEFDRKVADAKAAADVLEAQLKMLEARLASMRGFWNYFRRRDLAAEIETERAAWDVAATSVTDLSDDRADVEATPPPDFPGISIDGRRVVNTAVIAFAQQLAANLASGGVAMLTKETTTKRVFDVRYGSREDCGRLMALLRDATALIDADTDDLTGLKERIDGVRAAAIYRNDADTIPLTDSIGTLPIAATPVSGLESINRAGINVLVDDYWELYRSLMQ